MARDEGMLRDLALVRGDLDRCAHDRTDPTTVTAALANPHTRVLPVAAPSLPVVTTGAGPRLALRAPEAGDPPERAIFLGRDDAGIAYLAVPLDPASDGTPPAGPGPDGAEAGWRTLRQVGADLPGREAGIAATALALAQWHATHGFCPRCGTPTTVGHSGWTRQCPADGSEHYPRTDPAVIMSVVDDADRILLARARGFRAKGASVLAGFVEPGESLAQTVAREVAEEVGVTVTDVRYLGDQPWPFPTGMMIGFTCRALTTGITEQPDEIEHARWWTRDELTRAVAGEEILLPPRVSIARRLIERWYGGPILTPDHILR